MTIELFVSCFFSEFHFKCQNRDNPNQYSNSSKAKPSMISSLHKGLFIGILGNPNKF